jgi:(p)ppGpp synthase/HD superfamily hydrolase
MANCYSIHRSYSGTDSAAVELQIRTVFMVQAAEAAELARKAFASEKSDCIASNQQSDHLVMLAAYSGWQAALNNGGPRLAREYTKKHCLSFQTLQMLKDMRYQFASMLAEVKYAFLQAC